MRKFKPINFEGEYSLMYWCSNRFGAVEDVMFDHVYGKIWTLIRSETVDARDALRASIFYLSVLKNRMDKKNEKIKIHRTAP